MNKRMKKKATKTKQLSRKERIRNQRKELHRLFKEKYVIEDKLQVYKQFYEEQCRTTKYWREAFAATVKELDEERAKPWWKKVLHG